MNKPEFLRLSSPTSTLVIDCRGDSAAVLYWGAALNDDTSDAMLELIHTRQEAPCSAERESAIHITPVDGAGFLGQSGLRLHRQGRAWSPQLSIQSASIEGNSVTVLSSDKNIGIELRQHLSLDTSGVLRCETELVNRGEEDLCVDYCAAATLPVPMHLDRHLSFEGRWAKEFQLQSTPRYTGTYLRENRTGRTSHDCFPGLIVCDSSTREQQGEAYGFHLGWSGNHRLCSEMLGDGRGYVQMGELLFSGEVILGAGESYRSPALFCAYSGRGLSPLSQQFHRYVRETLSQDWVRNKPRPIHYNTWEAVYFEHKTETLMTLADKAAELGVERFVLDDGWFRGRRGDNAGLGDWYVDKAIYPEGLGPLVEHVKATGMEFGLWVEPEMVNPDSDLYREHPDWALKTAEPPLLARNQLVLNLALPAVQDYLFERIDALLQEYDIAYLKWDMNRDLHQPGDEQGRPGTHRQNWALYRLLERIRTAHPRVEIETCASGGGRADYGVLAHTDRVWTSDSNDALDRLGIQHGFSFFFPTHVMGSHVGPHHCHITGRQLSMMLRSGVALFGHMGLEVNLLEFEGLDELVLKAAIDLHKQWRQLIHSGDWVRLDSPAWWRGFGVVNEDRSDGLFCYATVDGHNTNLPQRYRFADLDANAKYEINIVWPLTPYSNTSSILDRIQGAVISGEALMQAGIQMPLLQTDNLLIFALHKQ